MISNNNLNNTIAYQKIKYFCAYQERCNQEVIQKLYQLGVYKYDQDEFIAELIQENFLNESRFAEVFARGKHNIKLWGKEKIRKKLIEKGMSSYNIADALDKIDEDDYKKNLNKILHKRLNDNFDFLSTRNALKFCLLKGYEYQLILDSINLIKRENE